MLRFVISFVILVPFLVFILRRSKEFDKQQKERELNRIKKLELCNKFIREHPDNLYAIKYKIMLYSVSKQYQEVINTCKYLINKKPNDFHLIIVCAKIYAYSGDMQTALNLINYLYKNKEKDDIYHEAIKDCMKYANYHQLYMESYKKAVELDPDNEDPHSRELQVFSIMGDKGRKNYNVQIYKELLETEKGMHDDINSFNKYLENNGVGYLFF